MLSERPERRRLVCKSSTDFLFFSPESMGKACRRSFEEIARFIIALQKKMALCSSTQKKMKAIDEMGLQSMLPGLPGFLLAKDFVEKKP